MLYFLWNRQSIHPELFLVNNSSATATEDSNTVAAAEAEYFKKSRLSIFYQGFSNRATEFPYKIPSNRDESIGSSDIHARIRSNPAFNTRSG